MPEPERLEDFETHFRYDHLPDHLQAVSKVFHDAFQELRHLCTEGPELTSAVRKLWEAKNSAVLHAGFIGGLKAQPKQEYTLPGQMLSEQDIQILRDAGVAPGTVINRQLLDTLTKGEGV